MIRHESQRILLLKKQARREFAALVIGAIVIIVPLAIFCGGLYVAFHFITKFW